MKISRLLYMSFILLFLLVSCNTSKKSNKKQKIQPNVIIFIADDVSWNDFGCYGNKDVKTPNIDYLAKNGLKFNNAILTTSSCSPSRISILTGRYPHNTGAAELHTEPKVDFQSIASLLKTNGYYTGQAGKWHMGKLLRKGFDKIYETRKVNGDGGEKMWIPSLEEKDQKKPFFFWFASYDAHRPWGKNSFSKTHDSKKVNVPKTLLDSDSTKIDIAKYYDEISRFDDFIGKSVQKLKEFNQLDNTVIIVMADNGRPFPRDKTRMYDSGMKTPFIVYAPNIINKGAETNSLISSVDIAPTIMELCNIKAPKTFQGKSFAPILYSNKKEIRKYAYAEHNWHDYEAHERMVRTKDYLYILNSRPELPNQGPADAVTSVSFRELARKKELLTDMQSDIFLAPRPTEELYFCTNDILQTQNLTGVKKYDSIYFNLKNHLTEWMKNTNDNIPENLTKDWYTRDKGQPIPKNMNIRGEMPGRKTELK